MDSEDRNRKASNWDRVRAMQHIGMGSLYIVIGGLLFWVKAFGTISLSKGVAYSLGALLLLYGIFRIWRGFKDLKANKE